MKSNFDSKTCIECEANFYDMDVKKITRTYCELCGDVVFITIEYNNGKIEEKDLNEFHTGCSE
jgi:hypothetical protein